MNPRYIDLNNPWNLCFTEQERRDYQAYLDRTLNALAPPTPDQCEIQRDYERERLYGWSVQ